MTMGESARGAGDTSHWKPLIESPFELNAITGFCLRAGALYNVSVNISFFVYYVGFFFKCVGEMSILLNLRTNYTAFCTLFRFPSNWVVAPLYSSGVVDSASAYPRRSGPSGGSYDGRVSANRRTSACETRAGE